MYVCLFAGNNAMLIVPLDNAPSYEEERENDGKNKRFIFVTS